ncbi:uncharacterized protein MEPE_03679 [Melanopsichium pennsylvanicum]|uniref:Uncharacterized protein n=1 Tax=Melanopsichium pennsylvanicum TaxID=63383 RepID=A0AAJ4XMJ3_9BASI|nr:uncharacterized protein MEPE_03679 [Melanopsichium pennsylvanicum]
MLFRKFGPRSRRTSQSNPRHVGDQQRERLAERGHFLDVLKFGRLSDVVGCRSTKWLAMRGESGVLSQRMKMMAVALSGANQMRVEQAKTAAGAIRAHMRAHGNLPA